MTVPDKAREPCAGAPLPPGPSVSEAEHQTFGFLQSGFLQLCDEKRGLGVYSADAFNQAMDRLQSRVEGKRGWEHVFGKRLKEIEPFELETDQEGLYGGAGHR